MSLKLVSLKYAHSDNASQIVFIKSKTVRAKNIIDKREVCLIILNIRDLKTSCVEGHYASIDVTFLFFQLFNSIFSGIDTKDFRAEIEIIKGSNMGYGRLFRVHRIFPIQTNNSIFENKEKCLKKKKKL